MLPVILVAVTALITTAIVEAIYSLFYLWHYAFGSAPPSHDWAGSLSVSGIATAIVLLAGVFAQRLLVGRSVEITHGRDIPSPAEAGPAASRAAGTPE